MSEVDALSNTQAYARALRVLFDSSNPRTHARDLQRTTYFDLETYVSNARGGAEENWPKVGERWPVLRTARTHRRHEIPQNDRIFIYVRDGFRCGFCGKSGKEWERNRVQLVPDHVVPWSAYGSDHVNNLRTLCWDCNDKRSNIRTDLDAAWNPIPVTYECVRCWPDLPREDPSVQLAFCYFHRTRALGVVDV